MAIDIDPDGVEPRAILASVDLRGKSVLEVGAGDGRLTFRYASEPRSIFGIDTKEGDIRSAKVRARGVAEFLCADATALPFPAERFEIVLLASSL